MKWHLVRTALGIIAALFVSIDGKMAFAGPNGKVETIVVSTPAKFVMERPVAAGSLDTELDTFLIIPLNGLDFKILWDRDVVGQPRRFQPIELESGREYTFYVKQTMDKLGTLMILEIKVNGTVIWPESFQKIRPQSLGTSSPGSQ